MKQKAVKYILIVVIKINKLNNMTYEEIDTESVMTINSRTRNIDELIKAIREQYIDFNFLSAEYLGQSQYTNMYKYKIKFQHTSKLELPYEALHSKY